MKLPKADYQFIYSYNGKYGGQKILNPLGMVNDGVIELMYFDGLVGLAKAFKLFDQAENGGTHIYDPEAKCVRVENLRVVNKSRDCEFQDFSIDGEALKFKKFAKTTVMK